MSDDGVANGRRREITRRAAVLFERLGYHETSMDDIAQAMGLKKPTLYHYVDSKAQIVYWIHEELETELSGRLRSRLQAGIPPAQNLLEVMYDIFDIMETHPGHLRVYFENHRNLPTALQSTAKQRRDQYFSMVESVVADGIERGELRAMDTRLTTLALFGMCNWSYQWYRPGGTRSARDIAYHMWGLFTRGAASPEWKAANAIASPAAPGIPLAEARSRVAPTTQSPDGATNDRRDWDDGH